MSSGNPPYPSTPPTLMLLRTCVAAAALASLAPAPVSPAPIDRAPFCVTTGDFSLPRQGPTTIFQLDGSGSFDPEGDPFSFEWQSSPNVVFDDPTLAKPTVTVPTPANLTVIVPVRLRVYNSDGESYCRLFVTILPEQGGDLDIKPGSCPNPVQTGGGSGLVPVALIGTAGFDVADVQLATLQLGRADGVGGTVAPSQIHVEDAATPFTGEGCDCHTLTADGITDLSLKFSRHSLVSALQIAGVPDKSYLPLVLTGQLADGTSFAFEDCIRVQH